MNIVVPMKQIPDLQQIRIRDRKPLLEGVPTTYSAIDKNALEAAVELKEAADDDEMEVVVLSFGDEDVEDTVKEAMAAGGDRSVLITDDDAYSTESADVATILAAAIKDIDDAQLIIFGEGSGDNYSGQVGSRVAEILGYPQVGFVSEIQLSDGSVTVTRALEDSLEVLEMPLPAVISVIADLNTARTPSVMQVLKAGKKEKEVLELDDLDVEIGEGATEVRSNLAPVTNRKNIMVKSTEELLSTLESEHIIER